MSVPNQTPYIIYNANGLTTVFPFEFYIISASDIQVTINGETVTSGFTVAGVGNVRGGDINFLTPPANGAVVMLERVVPTYRLTDYQDNGDLLADTVNKDFDRLWMAIQRAFIYMGLALKRPLLGGPFDAEGYRIEKLADPVNDLDAVNKKYVLEQSMLNLNKTLRVPEAFIPALPTSAGRVNKLLGFDSAGSPVAVLPSSGSASEVMLELAAEDGEKYIGECQTVARLRQIEPERDGQRITVREHTFNTGYGGGQFRALLDGSTHTDNDGTIIVTAGGAVWLRINAEVITPLMFGAIPDGVTDCSAAFTNSLSAGSIIIPDGDFVISDVQVPARTSITGFGLKSKIRVNSGRTGFLVGNASAMTRVDYFDGSNIKNIHLISNSTDAETIGIKTDGVCASVFQDIYFTKLRVVIKQDHAAGCKFINISNSDLEDGSTDPVFVIFSQITKRSNDNSYMNFAARSSDTEIFLGIASGASLTEAQHDGINIEGNILFPCRNDNVYVANGRMGKIINNELFVAGRNGIRIDTAVTNMSITGNNIPWSGRLTAGGADAILIQTAAGSAATAYGQVDVSNNIISMPAGCGIRIAGVGQATITNNTIVSPNNIKTTATGPFTAKQYDAIRINSACGYILVSDNNVTTGRHGQGGDDFTTNWRYDVFIESLVINGFVKHPGINVLSLSPYIEIQLPVVKYIQGKHQTLYKEVNSPYAITNWSTVSGSGTFSVASATNPYGGELTNSVLQFVNTSGTSVFSRGENTTSAGDPIGAVFKVRCTSQTSAYITFSIVVGGAVFIQRSIMVGAGWGEVDMRRLGAPAGVVAFNISTSDTCTIQLAETRVTRTSEAPQLSGTYYGTSIPTAGYYKIGDIVKNSAPAAGAPRGWVCTASGTPGSWISEGNL